MKSVVEVPVRSVNGAGPRSERLDALAVEEPLEIKIDAVVDARSAVRTVRTVSITMRTPGDDFDLACGFLFTEGVIAHGGDVTDMRHCGGGAGSGGESDASFRNAVCITLADDVKVDLARLERHFYTSSSCGVCGKTSLEAVRSIATATIHAGAPRIEARTVHAMPEALRRAQAAFAKTGGLHAAGLFDETGALLAHREDVGRHNAVDKLIGAELRAGRIPLANRALLLSGRASFELVQKARVAGVAFVAAVGAPSSLAVELAEDSGITLLGFVRDGRFNVYAGEERVS